MTTSSGRFVVDEVANQRHRKKGGAKTPPVTTAEMWEAAVPGVISRLKAFLADSYADIPDGDDHDGETL